MSLTTWSNQKRTASEKEPEKEPLEKRPETAWGNGGSSLYPDSGPCEGGTHVVVMSTNISTVADKYKRSIHNISYFCEFGVVRVPAHSYTSLLTSTKVVKTDPDRNSLWCITPTVMSCGQVPFALYATIPKQQQNTKQNTKEQNTKLKTKLNTETIETNRTTDLLLVDELEVDSSLSFDNALNDDNPIEYINLKLGTSISFTYIDSALTKLHYTPQGIDVHLSHIRGECNTPSVLTVKGMNLNVDADRTLFGCRFGNRVVPAFVNQKIVDYNNIGQEKG